MFFEYSAEIVLIIDAHGGAYLKYGHITVKQQLQCKDGNYFLETPKSGKNRTILPAPIVMDALRNQMERQQKEQEQESVPLQRCCNMPLQTGSSHWLWQSFGKVVRHVARYVTTASSTLRATASASLYLCI